MHAIDRGDRPILELTRHGFVRREHEFFDQLVRFIVLDAFEEDRLAFLVQPHFHLWKIEVEGSLLETLLAQKGGEFPGHMQPLAQLVVRRGAKNRVSLAISQAARAADDRSGEADALRSSVFGELKEGRVGEAVHLRLQAANAVAQSLRQHGNDAIGEIDAVAPVVGFTVQRPARFHVGGDIGDMDTEAPAAAGEPFDVDRVIEIARIVRVDRDDELVAQILASLEHFFADGFRDSLRFFEDVSRKFRRKMVLPDDGQHVHAGRGAGPKDFDDLALGIDMARFPRFETDDDLIAALRFSREQRLRWNLDVNVVDNARIIRNDVEKVFRLLQSSDDRIVRTFQDADHPSFGAPLAGFRAGVTFIAGDPGHHFVAVHRGAGIFGGDEKILLSRLPRRKKGVARLVHVQRPRHEIRLRGQDVAVLADTGDFSGLLELAQHLVQSLRTPLFRPRAFPSSLSSGRYFGALQQAEDLFTKLLIVDFTILKRTALR